MTRTQMIALFRVFIGDKQSMIDATTIINVLLFSAAQQVQSIIEDVDPWYFTQTSDNVLDAGNSSITFTGNIKQIRSVQRVDNGSKQVFQFVNFRDLIERTSGFDYVYSMATSNTMNFMTLLEGMTIRVHHVLDIVDVAADANIYGFTSGSTTLKYFPESGNRLIVLQAALDYVNAESTSYANLRAEYEKTLSALIRTVQTRIASAPRQVQQPYQRSNTIRQPSL